MYLFKQDTLRDGVIDTTKIDQWRQILNAYDESLKEITTPKNEEKIDLKKFINKSIYSFNRRNDKYKSSTI